MLQKKRFFVAQTFLIEGLFLVLFAICLWWISLSWLSLWIETWPNKIVGWLFFSFQILLPLAELGFMTRLKNQPRLVFLLTCFFVASVGINAGTVFNFLSGINAFPEIAGQSPFGLLADMNGLSTPFVLITILLVAMLTYVPKLIWEGGKMTSYGWSQLSACLKPAQELGSIKE
jgi:hypothetical protein